jgi:hypothetical protein
MPRQARFCGLLLLLVAAACADRTPFGAGNLLPPADLSLDPSHLRIGAILYACGNWWGLGRPDSPSVLVDVQFIVRGPDDPLYRPRDESVQAAEAVGFRPLFFFQFPMVRGTIATDRIPALGATGEVNEVLTVPDPRRYDVSVGLGFNRPLMTQDSLDFIALGGRVRWWWPFIAALAGDLPNASALAIRSRSDVKYLEAFGDACISLATDTIHPPAPAQPPRRR